VFHWLRSRRLAAVLAVAVLAGGCATYRVAHRAESAARRGDWDAAVYHYLEAVARDPENVRYRMALVRARQKAAQEHFKRGSALRELGNLIAAESELKMAVELDPTHQYAEQMLKEVQRELEILSSPGGEKTLEEIKKKAREAKVKPPVLNPRSKEPITLRFPRPTSVKEIYRALGKAFGFNVLFDPKLKDDKISVELNDVTPERALETVMQAAGHFYKVLDEHTIIVAEDTPQNRRDYEDLVIKTFFLSNAEVKDVDKMLRSLIEARRLATNEQLNAITLRDTADKVAIAEKLIEINDKAKAEVLVDVELMEVNSTKLRELGTKLSTYSIGLNLDPSRVTESGGDSIYLNELSNISNGDWTVTVPNVLINLIKNSTDAVSLAQPQLRITEGEKASLVIGQRLPIPVTTFNTANTVGGNIVPLTSYQYQDVGIKIDVEPRVHHNREITLKLSVEVSSQAGEVQSPNGQVQPIIGTRTINTVIRLKDGETNMLVGLYKEDTSVSETKIPLLSDIPLLGKLFTNTSKKKQTTDLVLTLTPHIIRFPDIREEDLAPLWVGTEKRISYYGNSPRVRSGRQVPGPFDRPEGSRREIRRPPAAERGLRRRTPPLPRQLRPPKRVSPPRGPGRGVSLVPPSNRPKGSSARAIEPEVVEDPAGAPPAADVGVLVTMEPAALTLAPGETADLEIRARGVDGPMTLPLTLTADPKRLRIEGISGGEGAAEVSGRIAPDGGVAALIATLPADGGAERVVARVRVHALAPGAAPVVLASGWAELPGGVEEPVAASGSAVAVSDGEADSP